MKNDYYILSAWIIISLIIGWFIGVSVEKNRINPPAVTGADQVSERKAFEFKLGVRKLWEDHIAWTRLAIKDIVSGASGTEATVNRLLKNPVDFKNVLSQYYGDDNANQFAKLLTDHLTIAAELVSAAKAWDSPKATDAEKRWYANADALAGFLSSANPHLPKKDLTDMFYSHLKLTKGEAVAEITKNYDTSVSDYDQIHIQALAMADALADAIVKQFPDKFK